MTEETRPDHSPLGASGAERWMNCPGSVGLLRELKLPPSDEPEYRRHGTAAHEANYACLTKGQDAWEVVGEKFNNTEVDAEMAEAMQVYLTECRSLITPDAKVYYEFGIDAPDFHKDFYGTLDFGCVAGTVMRVRDYKHGEGIAVDVEFNPQVMYYAYGLLRHHPEVTDVELGIVQPRITYQEPVKIWKTTAEAIRAWAENELKPAMDRTAMDNSLDAGPWCRFCPAKLVCPLMHGLWGAAIKTDPKFVVNLTDARLGQDYQYIQAVKFFIKAMEDETFRRLNKGDQIPGAKLVQKKANRVHKEGAAAIYTAAFGEEAMTKPELKSPAEIDKLGPKGKTLTREWAYTPQSGLTVALETDKRQGVKVQSTTEAFPNALAAGQTQEELKDE